MTEENENGIMKDFSDMELRLAPTDIQVDTTNSIKLPLDQLLALGVAFSSMPETFRTVTQNISAPHLLVATDQSGNFLDPSIFSKFNDGSGLLGSIRVDGGFEQVRLQQIAPGSVQPTATVPYDPTSLFMAAALAQVNQKLDAIQETQQEMFEYLKQKDKASLRGDLQALINIFNDYKFNWNTKQYLNNAHLKTFDIKQEADKAIVHLRAQISTSLQKEKPLESRKAVSNRVSDLVDELIEYQLANYIYSFAAFLDPLLCSNFEEDYLANIEKRISEYALRYREMYTLCYDHIESSLSKSVDVKLLKGASFIGKKLGSAIEKTPVGKATPIDEALLKAGTTIGDFNEEQSKKLIKRLITAKEPNVSLFQTGIETLNTLNNKQIDIAADSENIYLLPHPDEDGLGHEQ